MGWKEVECIRICGLNEEQKKAYILVHNQLTLNSDFDLEILAREIDNIKNIDLEEFDIKLDEDEKEILKEDKPEVEFSQEVDEVSNYIVLKFDNTVDWLQAQTYFGLKPVKQLGEHGREVRF